MENLMEELREAIGTYVGEWLTVYTFDGDHYPVKNPMVMSWEEDVEIELKKLAEIASDNNTEEIYASGMRVY